MEQQPKQSNTPTDSQNLPAVNQDQSAIQNLVGRISKYKLMPREARYSEDTESGYRLSAEQKSSLVQSDFYTKAKIHNGKVSFVVPTFYQKPNSQ